VLFSINICAGIQKYAYGYKNGKWRKEIFGKKKSENIKYDKIAKRK